MATTQQTKKKKTKERNQTGAYANDMCSNLFIRIDSDVVV